MTYYILLPDDAEKDTQFSSNVLGEESFGTFYPEQGMEALLKIINNEPEMVSKIRIIDDRKNEHTLTEFIDHLNNLRIRNL